MTRHLTAYARLNVITTGTVSDVLANTEEDLRRLADAARAARRLTLILQKVQMHSNSTGWTRHAKSAARVAATFEALAGCRPQLVVTPSKTGIPEILLDAYNTTGEIAERTRLAGCYRLTLHDMLIRVRKPIALCRIDLSDWLRDIDMHPTKPASDPKLREWRKKNTRAVR
jgi:hypothetical protein